MNGKRRLVITISLVVAGFALWIIFSLASHHGEAKVTVKVLPSDSTLSIDGKAVKPGVSYLTPGRHTLSAGRQGFTTVTKILDLKKTDVEQVTLVPAPSTSQALQYLQQHPEVQQELQALGDNQANQIGQSLVSRWPIISELPHTDPNGAYVLNYGLSDNNTNFYLIVDNSSPDGRAGALRWIKQQGYDPTNFLIKYKDFANPFTNGQAGGSQ